MALGFRPLGREDFDLLGEWLSSPHVARWWREQPGEGAIESKFGASVDGSDPTEAFVVEREDRPIGLVQRYRLGSYPEWISALAPAGVDESAAGIDYLIGVPEFTGRGIGSRMIATFVAQIWNAWADVGSIVASVEQDNVRSWRALENAGFERIWSGTVDSGHPSDDAPEFVYVVRRPPAR